MQIKNQSVFIGDLFLRQTMAALLVYLLRSVINDLLRWTMVTLLVALLSKGDPYNGIGNLLRWTTSTMYW